MTEPISLGRFVAFPIKGKYVLFDSNTFAIYTIPIELFHLLNEKDEVFVQDLLKGHLLKDVSEPHKRQKPEPLSNITINVSQTCNLRCIYCYANGGEYGMRGIMSLETAKKCVDFLLSESRSLKVVTITFFGGEPLLNFEVMKATTLYALEQAKALGKRVRFGITTNGTLLSKQVNEFLNTYKFGVTISFDGDKRIQDANRPQVNGMGSFDLIYPKVKSFLTSRNGNATARATITDKNTDIKQVEEALKQIGFKKVNSTFVTVSDQNTSESLSTITLDDQVTRSKFEALKMEASQILLAINQRKLKEINPSSELLYYLRLLFSKKARLNFCGVGRTMVAIACNGDVYPCHRFVGDESFRLGNINCFDSSNRIPYSAAFVFTHPVCSKCWARFLCGGGGCVQDNYFTNGETQLLNPVQCARVKVAAREAIGIYLELSEKDKTYLRNYHGRNSNIK